MNAVSKHVDYSVSLPALMLISLHRDIVSVPVYKAEHRFILTLVYDFFFFFCQFIKVTQKCIASEVNVFTLQKTVLLMNG